MTPHSRVTAALRREPTDRIPVFLWFHPATVTVLGRLLHIPPAAVADVMGNDIHQAWVGNNSAMEGIVHERDGDTHTDPWGITWVKEGPFNQILHAPLQESETDALAGYRFPHDRISALLDAMESAARPGYFLGCDVSPCLFEMLCRLRGMENAAVDLATGEPAVATLLEGMTDFEVELSEAACVRWSPDWLWTGDDVAGQRSMIMSPAVWRALLKPRLARIVAVGKRRGIPVAYHCCGAVRPIIPDLVEIGVDVLNPVQTTSPGMNPEELSREFGSVLGFMGGVDTVELLPRGSPEDVYAETRRLIDLLGGKGCYILSASHTVPPETPEENIFAMLRAANISREEIFDHAADVRAGTRETRQAPPSPKGGRPPR